MHKRAGFTLIELLVVISIIGLLSSVTLAALSSARKKARDVLRIAHVKQLQNALEMYREQFGTYPRAINYGEQELGNPPAGCYGFDTSVRDWNSNGKFFLEPLSASGIMSSVPLDPVNKSTDNCDTGFLYRYAAYDAGSAGCDKLRGDFYILQVMTFESFSGLHPLSPGFRCGAMDWSADASYVVSNYAG